MAGVFTGVHTCSRKIWVDGVLTGVEGVLTGVGNWVDRGGDGSHLQSVIRRSSPLVPTPRRPRLPPAPEMPLLGGVSAPLYLPGSSPSGGCSSAGRWPPGDAGLPGFLRQRLWQKGSFFIHFSLNLERLMF